MMKRIVPALVMLAPAAGAAVAEQPPERPFRAIDYPIEVRRALSYGPEECRRQGGGKVTFAANTVRKVDLTGDGVDDYIVSFAKTTCAGRQAVYCGTAGCTLDIYVTLPNGKRRMVFSDRVWGYDILPGEGARTLRFDLHGSYCGGAGASECSKEHKITHRSFEFTEPKD